MHGGAIAACGIVRALLFEGSAVLARVRAGSKWMPAQTAHPCKMLGLVSAHGERAWRDAVVQVRVMQHPNRSNDAPYAIVTVMQRWEIVQAQA